MARALRTRRLVLAAYFGAHTEQIEKKTGKSVVIRNEP
jgi:hypothetical protein